MSIAEQVGVKGNMYLDELQIENFRLFGAKVDGKALSLKIRRGLNLIVGPNDSGKTCLIDAIRLLVGTVTADYFPITEDDFHVSAGNRAQELTIQGTFRGFTIPEAGAMLEYLSTEEIGGSREFVLKLRLTASLLSTSQVSARKTRVRTELRAGPDADGARFDGQARQILAATYLKPLRDAISELASRKGSRLSQILRAYDQIAGHEQSDWSDAEPDKPPSTLMGIAQQADHRFRNTDVIRNAESDINNDHLRPFSIGNSLLTAQIKPGNQDLRQVLERFELSPSDSEPNTSRGLGVYNLLFIATELLALTPGSDPELPLLLIEEPEAHLHPQYQQRLVEYIKDKTQNSGSLQVMLTSHSPHFASEVPVENLTMMHGGRAFPLSPDFTKLDKSDYAFLSRFLDVTKANLFFASGVIIVEGDAEALLLPTLARLIDRPLDQYGVSIVNVGHVGLFRYSRVFQRTSSPDLPVRVACITDLDVPPGSVKYLKKNSNGKTQKRWNAYTAQALAERIAKRKGNDGGPVLTFVSDTWTLEYALALSPLAEYVHAAVTVAKQMKSTGVFPSGMSLVLTVVAARREIRDRKEHGQSNEEIAIAVYEPLYKNNASKAETAQVLGRLLERLPPERVRSAIPDYLVDAICHATGATHRGAGVGK